MKVSYLDHSKLNKFYYFNSEIFSNRKNYIENINFWFSKNKNEYNLTIIVNGENDEIWGQILSSSMYFFYDNNLQEGNWIFDYIIKEDKRKDGYGIDVLQFAMQHKNVPIFAVGSGPLALKIELKMGFKMLGELKKYVGIVNPVYLVSSIFRGIIPINKFPAKVNTKGKKFVLIKKSELPELSDSFNNNYLEFGRDIAFLRWRYFSKLSDYAFYKNEETEDYFVLRTIVKKQITCLVLVDYRCDFSNSQNFELLFKAVKKVATKLHLTFVITGSSLKEIDSILERSFFKSIGRPRPIIANKLFKNESERIKNREFILTTLADSDGETGW